MDLYYDTINYSKKGKLDTKSYKITTTTQRIEVVFYYKETFINYPTLENFNPFFVSFLMIKTSGTKKKVGCRFFGEVRIFGNNFSLIETKRPFNEPLFFVLRSIVFENIFLYSMREIMNFL